MFQRRQWRAVACRFTRRLAVENMQTAMVSRQTRYHLCGHLRCLGNQGTHQTALAALGQGHGLFHVVVRHERANRAESFNVVNAVGAQGLLTQEQCGLEERTVGNALAHQAETGIATAYQFGALSQQGHALGDIGLL